MNSEKFKVHTATIFSKVDDELAGAEDQGQGTTCV